ncbi:hypothetical protein ACI65C_013301 [Semiaphis heraclei]
MAAHEFKQKMPFALSKSSKRRRCLEEIEELGLAIDSNPSCNNHDGNYQPSSSEQHISHTISNNISNDDCDPTPIFFEKVEGPSFKRKLTFGVDNLKKKAYPLENISRHLSPCKSPDPEKSTLFRRNNLYESNHMQTSLFSPVIINSDNDNGEGTSFFNKKLGFRSDNSKERRNQLENNRYLSPSNSPDKEFKKQIIRHVMYFKVELKHITNTLTNNHYELLERVQSIEKFLEDKPTKFYEQKNLDINCMSDCSMPINNIMDLNTLEDKTLGDQEFKKALVSISYFK